ncbi:MAG: L,D-transpeptidase family protein [Steroidobacteraceae bacterium]|jgi:L,D-transpeptidase ErfK/SrfK
MSRTVLHFSVFAAALFAPAAQATMYELPPEGSALFGSVEHTVTAYEDTLIDLGRRYSLGYEEIRRVNPGVDPWLPGDGTAVLLPGQRILPAGPRDGIVVNLPEHRLYYYPKPKKGEKPVVYTYPVSIGKMDWKTPLGKTRITQKEKNPNWYPPASVRKEHAERGDPLPAVVPPGPDNPLGAYKMRLAFGGGSYLIHGTNNPAAVGMAITHGCIRMYPEDIEQLYSMVPVGTSVYLVNEPVKVAIVDGEVYMEAHPPVDDEGQVAPIDLNEFAARLDKALGPTRTAVHWDYALQNLGSGTGMPVLIGIQAEDDSPDLAPSAPVADGSTPAPPGS